MTIDQQHPEVSKEFCKGHFVAHKSWKVFSSTAIDQAYEQNNAVTKDDGRSDRLDRGPHSTPEVNDSWTTSEPSSRSLRRGCGN